MKFAVDPKIFEKWPGVKIGVLVLTGIDNSGHNEGIMKLLRDEESKKKGELAGRDFGQMPEVVVWREVYRAFGSNPHDFRSSVEALLRRVRAGNNLPQINNLVDLYNYLSIKYHLTAGAEDLDKVKGDISLTFSDGRERGRYIGSDTVETCDKGEVIYKDEMGFICRKWNWREGDRTKIDPETKNAVLVLENAAGELHQNLEEALDETEKLVLKYLGGKVERFVLSRDNLELMTEFKTTLRLTASEWQAGSKAGENGFWASQNDGAVSHSGEERSDDSRIKTDSGRSASWRIARMTIKKGHLPPEDSLAYELITKLHKAVTKLFPDISMLPEDVSVEHPEDENHGDYATSIALRLSKQLHKNPFEIAGEITKEFPTDTVIENIEPVKPGFINFWLAKDYLSEQVGEAIETGDEYGKNKTKSGMKIAVEYTDPNPFKEFHLGHLYSNVIGESVARMLEASGATVWRGDFYGDVGMHVAKSVWGMMKKMEEKKVTLKELEQQSIAERQKFLGQGYALGVRKFEEDKQIQEEIKDLNYLVYVASQEVLKKTKGWKPIINYKQYIYGKDQNYEEVKRVYEAGLRWSLEYFETIYKRLGTKFDGYYPESWVGEYGMKMVEKGLKMGVLEKSEGVVVYKGEQDGLHTRVFVNKLGLPTYEAKDLGLAFAKYQDFKYDLSINVFGKEIDEYYKVVRAAMIKIEPELGMKANYITHGMVRLPEGKMSSRSGNVITFEGLMEEVKKRILAIMKASKEHFDLENPEEVAEKVAMGAIRYALLRTDIGKDVVFSFETSLSFEGDSGPYLQYTHARCESVLRKLNTEVLKLKTKKSFQFLVFSFQLNTEEMAVLRTIYRFPEVVLAAGEKLAPNLICGFLFDLAQKYNNFYNKHRILHPNTMLDTSSAYNKHSILRADNEASRDFRLALTKATATVLKNGLGLLGIEAPEKM